MSSKNPEPETTRQYGVKYPDGRSFWILNENATHSQLPGAFGVTSLATATDRGKFLDAWRGSIAACGVDPDTVPKPQFIARDLIKKFGDPIEIDD